MSGSSITHTEFVSTQGKSRTGMATPDRIPKTDRESVVVQPYLCSCMGIKMFSKAVHKVSKT